MYPITEQIVRRGLVKMNKTEFEQSYRLIKQSLPRVTVDSLEAIKHVEEHRQFWKPNQTNVVLLAESHVYTDREDFEIELDKTILSKLPSGYPSHFVRFVYCLGYGENEILTKKPTRKNAGTPQYWKIFCSCVAENKDNLGFEKVIKRGTKRLVDRLQNKLNILQHMKKKGIWLLDASIVGLYGNEAKKFSEAYRQIIEICWDNYLKRTIEETNPKYIIVIGKQVEKTLQSRLDQLGIPYETLPQPQAHLTQEEHLKNFQRYNEICNSVLKGKKVTKPTKYVFNGIPKSISYNTKKLVVNTIEENLRSQGYRKISRTEWKKKDRVTHVLSSGDFGPYIRITWKEKWKNDHAVIFDYSKANGPVCIVPIAELFNTNFVREKRQQESYTNSGYWWTRRFPLNRELAQFVLGYKNRWDIL